MLKFPQDELVRRLTDVMARAERLAQQQSAGAEHLASRSLSLTHNNGRPAEINKQALSLGVESTDKNKSRNAVRIFDSLSNAGIWHILAAVPISYSITWTFLYLHNAVVDTYASLSGTLLLLIDFLLDNYPIH